MTRFIDQHSIEVAWGFFIVLALGFVSIIWFEYTSDKSCCWLISNLIVTLIIIVFIWGYFFRWRKKILLTTQPKKKDAIALVCFVMLILGMIHYKGVYYNNDIYYAFFKDNIGGFFVILIGFATVIGTYLAIRSITEMKHIITSYSHLMDSLIDIINGICSENRKNKGEVKKLRIVSYFVLPGYWQVTNKDKVDRFEKALLNAQEYIEIVCLDKEDHLGILINVAGKKTPAYPDGANSTAILELQQKSEELINNFHKVKRLPQSDLPHYFFFVTDKRAIIITPVGLPTVRPETSNVENLKMKIQKIARSIENFLKNKDNDSNKEHIKNDINNLLNRPENKVYVDTLGFETNDQHIIDLLEERFMFYDSIGKCNRNINETSA